MILLTEAIPPLGFPIRGHTSPGSGQAAFDEDPTLVDDEEL